jgi:hypothetical protein
MFNVKAYLKARGYVVAEGEGHTSGEAGQFAQDVAHHSNSSIADVLHALAYFESASEELVAYVSGVTGEVAEAAEDLFSDVGSMESTEGDTAGNNDAAFPGTDDTRTVDEVSDYIKSENAALLTSDQPDESPTEASVAPGSPAPAQESADPESDKAE